MSVTKQPRRRRLGIATQVFIGLGLGILVGVFFGDKAAFLKYGGDIFIALLQMTVIPYVVVALITSLGRLSLAEAAALGLRAGAVLLLLWVIGIAVVLLTPLAFPDWPSASFFSTSRIEEPPPVDFLRLYVPANIFYALANAVVPAIVVFSIIFGVALIRINQKQRLVDLLGTVGDTLLVMTGFVARIAPWGVFAITAGAAATIEIADLARLQVYLVVYVAMALLLSLWVIPGLIAVLTPLSFGSVLRAFRGPLVTAFATANVLIVLPVLAADGKELIARADAAAPGQGSPEDLEAEDNAIEILIPAAFPFPNLGLVLSLMFVLFGGWFVGSAVAIADYPTIAGAGLAALFGSTILALPFLFDLLQLPADLFQVFITVDVIGARFGTLLAGMHLIAIALIGAYALRGRLYIRPLALLRFAAISVALLFALLLGIRAFYTYIFVAPFTLDQELAGMTLLETPQPHQVYQEAMPAARAPAPNALARIQASGRLHACFRRSDYPSAFLNRDDELVGFDIEMTHRLARELDAEVAFVGVAGSTAAEQLMATGDCDLFMSLMPILPDLTERFAMTRPVFDGAVGLVVTDHRRREFETWAQVGARPDLRIAITDSRSARRALERLLPAAQPLFLADNEAIDGLLGADPPAFDVLLMQAEEGAAWTIRYPRFSLVVPRPVRMQPLGYALPLGEPELLAFVEAWLLMALSTGGIDQLYHFWMLGETDVVAPPRWSVARDVLGWFD
ncbi:MAG: hypothetical protein EA400_11035 [Chromatiaceae bacterium]|nr:MAG: hypothetical protein EA400_11035 [Chromatiaceae bacterium]